MSNCSHARADENREQLAKLADVLADDFIDPDINDKVHKDIQYTLEKFCN